MISANVVIVLVNPQSPGNIGSSARAMKNMGFSQLRVVNGPHWRDDASQRVEAEKMAWDAVDVLEAAESYERLPDAIADVSWVVALSARAGRYRKSRSLIECVGDLAEKSDRNRCAFLFGSERHGLTTEEVGHSQELVFIPTADAYPTLNLSQSVLLVCHQLFLHRVQPHQATGDQWATQEMLDGLSAHARRVLLEIGFLSSQNPDHALQILCTILGRAGLKPGEVSTLRGLLRQIDWASRRWSPSQW